MYYARPAKSRVQLLDAHRTPVLNMVVTTKPTALEFDVMSRAASRGGLSSSFRRRDGSGHLATLATGPLQWSNVLSDYVLCVVHVLNLIRRSAAVSHMVLLNLLGGLRALSVLRPEFCLIAFLKMMS
jgi:hypothetical protein